ECAEAHEEDQAVHGPPQSDVTLVLRPEGEATRRGGVTGGPLACGLSLESQCNQTGPRGRTRRGDLRRHRLPRSQGRVCFAATRGLISRSDCAFEATDTPGVARSPEVEEEQTGPGEWCLG